MFEIDQKAIQAANDILRAEKLLPSYLQEIEREAIHRKLGYANMHQYCTNRLKLSDSQAYTYISVARKCGEVPALKEALERGEISTQTARRMVPVIETKNCESWIQLAKELPQKALEREVAKTTLRENPQRAVRENIKPVAENVLEFRAGIDAETEGLLNRCRDLLSQKTKSAANWNQVVKTLAKEFLLKTDPVEKAKRNSAKPRRLTARLIPKRALPAAIKHQVFLRDQGKCQAKLPGGAKCHAQRFIEIHHRRPLSLGGAHSLDNLITLCSAHHGFQHTKPLGRRWRSEALRSV